MNLNYSDEQNMLREQVLKFCETNYDFIDREKILDSDSGYSEDNWKQFAELGWLAVPFKEDNGGFNFGPIELTVLFEESSSDSDSSSLSSLLLPSPVSFSTTELLLLML